MNTSETYKQKSLIPAPFAFVSKDDMYASSMEPIPRFLFLPMVKGAKGKADRKNEEIENFRKSLCLAKYHESA